MDRTALLTSLFDPSGFGLEIGPGYNPLLASGTATALKRWTIRDADGLRTKYRNAAVDLSRIEDLTYVSDGRPMVDIIGQRARYDFVIASHVIEHVPNLVGFLNDCDALLAEGGVLVLAVPDKRHCFDVLQATTGDVLQAFHEGRTRHPPGAVFDEIAYGALRGGKPGWGFGERGRFSFFHELSKAKLMFDQACEPCAGLCRHPRVALHTLELPPIPAGSGRRGRDAAPRGALRGQRGNRVLRDAHGRRRRVSRRLSGIGPAGARRRAAGRAGLTSDREYGRGSTGRRQRPLPFEDVKSTCRTGRRCRPARSTAAGTRRRPWRDLPGRSDRRGA